MFVRGRGAFKGHSCLKKPPREWIRLPGCQASLHLAVSGNQRNFERESPECKLLISVTAGPYLRKSAELSPWLSLYKASHKCCFPCWCLCAQTHTHKALTNHSLTQTQRFSSAHLKNSLENKNHDAHFIDWQRELISLAQACPEEQCKAISGAWIPLKHCKLLFQSNLKCWTTCSVKSCGCFPQADVSKALHVTKAGSILPIEEIIFC